jgi:hypothetical protein
VGITVLVNVGVHVAVELSGVTVNEAAGVIVGWGAGLVGLFCAQESAISAGTIRANTVFFMMFLRKFFCFSIRQLQAGKHYTIKKPAYTAVIYVTSGFC